MPSKFKNIDRKESQYRNRMLACVVAAEIIAIAFFTFWPTFETTDDINRDNFSEDVLAFEEVVRTEQTTPASPPRPQVPLPEPSDEVIEEEIIEMDDLNIAENSDTLSTAMLGQQGESDEPISNPQTSPSIVRIVEPTVPDEAKKEKIKAEIWVNFLVDRDGKVEEASISQIRLHDRNSGEVKEVESIGYGLTAATLDAALQWRFRPARDDGEVVKAYTRHIFTFGF